MFLTWLTPVGLRRLSRHWDDEERAGDRGRQRILSRAGVVFSHRQAQAKINISVPRVSPCHLLLLSLYSPLHSVFFHQRLFPWQTSSPCCLFDSQCQLLLTTVCVPLRFLSIIRATDTQKGSSPVARPSCSTAKEINITEQPLQRAGELCSNVIKV